MDYHTRIIAGWDNKDRHIYRDILCYQGCQVSPYEIIALATHACVQLYRDAPKIQHGWWKDATADE